MTQPHHIASWAAACQRLGGCWHLARLGMHAEGGLEQVIALLGDLHIQTRVGVSEDDLPQALAECSLKGLVCCPRACHLQGQCSVLMVSQVSGYPQLPGSKMKRHASPAPERPGCMSSFRIVTAA